MCDLINILSIIDDKTQLINFPKLDPNSFKPAVLALIQRLKILKGDLHSIHGYIMEQNKIQNRNCT